MSRSIRSARHRRLVELLLRHREAASLKQVDVAARLGRHQPYISNIEAGQRRVDLVELIDLSEAIGFDLHELLDELLRTTKG